MHQSTVVGWYEKNNWMKHLCYDSAVHFNYVLHLFTYFACLVLICHVSDWVEWVAHSKKLNISSSWNPMSLWTRLIFLIWQAPLYDLPQLIFNMYGRVTSVTVFSMHYCGCKNHALWSQWACSRRTGPNWAWWSIWEEPCPRGNGRPLMWKSRNELKLQDGMKKKPQCVQRKTYWYCCVLCLYCTFESLCTTALSLPGLFRADRGSKILKGTNPIWSKRFWHFHHRFDDSIT